MRPPFTSQEFFDVFARYDPEARLLKKKFSHYPPAGNRWVAQYLRDWLGENGLLDPESVRQRARTASPPAGP